MADSLYTLIDNIQQIFDKRLSKLEADSQRQFADLKGLFALTESLNESVPYVKPPPVEALTLNSITLSIETFFEAKRNKARLDWIMSPDNHNRGHFKTPSFGNILLSPKKSLAQITMSPNKINIFEIVEKEEENEKLTIFHLGENILLIAEYVGPEFLLLNKSLTSLYIEMRNELLDLLKEELINTCISTKPSLDLNNLPPKVANQLAKLDDELNSLSRLKSIISF